MTEPASAPPPPQSTWRFVRQVLVAIALVAVVLLLWTLRGVLLLLYAAILFGIVFDAVADGVHAAGVRSRAVALLLGVVAILLLLGGIGWIFGSELIVQLRELFTRLPGALHSFEREARSLGVDIDLHNELGHALPDSGTLLGALRTVLGVAGSVVSGFALAVLGGIYIAAQPRLYHAGLLLMVPADHVARIDEALRATGGALRAWMLGQFLSMAITTVLISAGLFAIGVPSPLGLGVIAGAMGFIPMIGPLLAAATGILVALTMDGHTLLLTVLLYFFVQQLAGAVIEPLIMQQTVKLPPAFTLFVLFAIGTLLGPQGVLLGGPLAVALFTLTRLLYVRDTLGHPIDGPPRGLP